LNKSHLALSDKEKLQVDTVIDPTKEQGMTQRKVWV